MYNVCSLTLDIYNQMYFSISVLHACGCHLKCWRNQLSFHWHWGWSHYHRLRFKLCALCFIWLFAETSKVDIRLVWITNYTNNVIHWSININFIFYHFLWPWGSSTFLFLAGQRHYSVWHYLFCVKTNNSNIRLCNIRSFEGILCCKIAICFNCICSDRWVNVLRTWTLIWKFLQVFF